MKLLGINLFLIIFEGKFMPKDKFYEFNNSKTLAVISPFINKGKNPCGFSIIRYTKLIINSFPKNQRVVIFCERGKLNTPYLETPNILVVPTYKFNSLKFFVNFVNNISNFGQIKNYLFQFEFSIFGGKIVIPQIASLLGFLKLIGKNTTFTFHQVVTDIETLSGHLAIKKGSIKAKLLNFMLKSFYSVVGILTSKVIVHDEVLAKRLSRFVEISKIRIIPHGVNQSKKLSSSFIKKSKEYFGVKKDTKLVGIFGYCSWYKGTDWLIKNFAKFARENPNKKVRLLVAGGEAPTLKGTFAYKKYHQKLKKVIKEANGNIIYTGYVPDGDVTKVFGAVDLFIFPYRTKMSASGAFALCAGFDKPYIVSSAFAQNLLEVESKDKMFNLNYKSFEKTLNKALINKNTTKFDIKNRSWKAVGDLYLKESLLESLSPSKLSYAQVA